MNNANNNLGYDRQTFLRVFSSLHLKDDIPPYPGWAADSQYYGLYLPNFRADMEDLANVDREEFTRILTIVSEPIRGRSSAKDLMIQINDRLPKPQPGGKRRRSRFQQKRKVRKSKRSVKARW
jgi:hypothetical protein